MNDHDIELLSQYLDGELDAAARGQLKRRLTAEPELRGQLHRFERLDRELRLAMAKEGHVPVHVAALLTDIGDKVVAMPRREPRRWGGLAIAASLLAGIAIVGAPGWIADSRDNLLVPDIEESAAFSRILESEPSRATGWLQVEDEVRARPVLSFASTGGAWCREFLASQGDETWRGVACRRGGSWDVELLVQTPGLAAENAGYKTAGAETADLVAGFIDSHSTAIPLGLEEEAKLIAGNWR